MTVQEMYPLVAEIIATYAEDGFTIPASWAGRMEAVASGAIEEDDAISLFEVMREALHAHGKGNLTSVAACDRALDDLEKWAGPIDSPNAQRLIGLGEYVDSLLAAAK